MTEPIGSEKEPSGGLLSHFISSYSAPLLLLISLILGVAAYLLTPQEEEPQIVVPIADIFIHYPGANPEEVEALVSTPLEQLLWQIDGVEYVYSSSFQDRAVVTVRFFVGEDRERSWVKLNNKISSHIDEAPPGVTGWLVKPIEVDDISIVNLTLHSSRYNDHALRRMAEELRSRLEELDDISRTRLVGGRESEIQVEVDPDALRGRNLTLIEVHEALKAADVTLNAGQYDRGDRRFTVRSGPFLHSVEEMRNVVIGVFNGLPVYLQDIALVKDGASEATTYSRLGFGPASQPGRPAEAAVTLAIAKKKGANAVAVADAIQQRMEVLKQTVLPSGVDYVVTRDYGQTARSKVNELLSSLSFAVITVILILMFSLGWREGLIVALAVPASFSLTLFLNYLLGYTINRVTLFALILTLGLVVDDPITNVDNIQRHLHIGKRSRKGAVIYAVLEVLPPVLISTLTIIVSFLPMFFITGMMGPYMQPMAFNVPAAVSFSTVCALTIVPWAAYRLFSRKQAKDMPESGQGRVGQVYRRFLARFLDSKAYRRGLLGLIIALFVVSAGLILLRLVPLKMLPFDNKNELQIVLEMSEGTTLERSDIIVRDFEQFLATVPEVTHFVSYTGTYSPIDFNGLVRHDYLREFPHRADIRIQLLDKSERSIQSHGIALRIRRGLEALAHKHSTRLFVLEAPPGPPVLSTLVAEVYGPTDAAYQDLIEASVRVQERMAWEPNVVDLDSTVQDSHQQVIYTLDREKAAIHDIDVAEVARTLNIALAGSHPATLHRPLERVPLRVKVQLSRKDRSGIPELGSIVLKSGEGKIIPLEEIGHFSYADVPQPIYHKNLRPVVYVMAETAGRAPGEAVLDMMGDINDDPQLAPYDVEWAGEGEWFITLRVFRDLGLAYGAALLGIFIILLVQSGSFVIPLVQMSAIPLTAIGVMPGFFILNVLVNRPVDGFPNPVFFTATAMIGIIALGGIVVRNSSVLISFIESAREQGQELRSAVLDSGAVRMRPIMLTALTTAIGVWPITLDPVFSGLAWSLIFGLVVSTAFSLILVPVSYFLHMRSEKDV